MYNKILVPLDGSKRAEAILSHVEQLASHFDAEVILMQVIEAYRAFIWPTESYVGPSLQEIRAQVLEQAQVYLDGLQRHLEAQGLRVRTMAVDGPSVEAIVTTATEEDVDLVALTSHGRTGLARVFYGSVAAGVLQRIDRPLLLIRSQGKE